MTEEYTKKKKKIFIVFVISPRLCTFAFKNGQVLIVKPDGKVYNMAGARIY